MHDEIEFMPLQPASAAGGDGADLRRLHDVPVELAVEIGRTRMTIGEALGLAPGAIVGLNRLAGQPVDLLVNGKPIARGEVVVIDEEFGLRVTDVVSGTRGTIEEEAVEAAEAAAGQVGVDPLGSTYGGGSDPLPDPFAHGDSLADASVDDLPMGGLPTPNPLG